MRTLCRLLTICAASLALAACEMPAPVAPTPPAARPSLPAPVRSQASLDLERHYALVEEDLRAQGLLRRDTGTTIPVSATRLATTFLDVALFSEYVQSGNRLVQQRSETVLHRWERPVRISLRFGASVPPSMRAADTRTVAAYADRLARASGHPVSLTSGGPSNFTVFVLYEDERRAYEAQFRAALPGIDETTLTTLLTLPRDTFCVVVANGAGRGTFSRAMAVVRAEHPDLLRTSCLHEEIAQGLGLVNDSPAARPSIFNDDEEFALLTVHDEQLLKMLYDPRLRAGMTLTQARPIAMQIAAELLGGES